MEINIVEQQIQITLAKKTLADLRQKLEKLGEQLRENPDCTSNRRELRKICLDITITENELEHAQFTLANKHQNSLQTGDATLTT